MAQCALTCTCLRERRCSDNLCLYKAHGILPSKMPVRSGLSTACEFEFYFFRTNVDVGNDVPCDLLFYCFFVMHVFVKLPGSRRHCAPMNLSGRMQCYSKTRLSDTSVCFAAPAYEQERLFLANVFVSSGRILSYFS